MIQIMMNTELPQIPWKTFLSWTFLELISLKSCMKTKVVKTTEACCEGLQKVSGLNPSLMSRRSAPLKINTNMTTSWKMEWPITLRSKERVIRGLCWPNGFRFKMSADGFSLVRARDASESMITLAHSSCVATSGLRCADTKDSLLISTWEPFIKDYTSDSWLGPHRKLYNNNII